MEFNLGKKQPQLPQQQQQHGNLKPAQQGSKSGTGQGQTGSGGAQQQGEQTEREEECDTIELADRDLEQQPLVQHSDNNSSSKAEFNPALANELQKFSPVHPQQQQLDAVSLPVVDAGGVGQAAAAAVGLPVLTGSHDCLQLRPGSSSESGGSGADVLVLPDMQHDFVAGSKARQGNLSRQQQQQHIALAVDSRASSNSSSPHDSSSRISSAAADSTTPPGAAQTQPAAAPAGPSDLQPPPTQQQQQPPDFWHSLRLLLRRPEVLIFMGQATAMGFGIGVIGEFLFLFLQELGGSETLMGLTLTFTCLAEVPVFHYQVCGRGPGAGNLGLRV
jgi:hypothetical protein